MKTNGLTRREFLKYAGVSMGAAGASTLLERSFVSAQTPKRGGHFKPALTDQPVVRSLDPHRTVLNWEDMACWTLFNSLLRFNKDMRIVPDLAESWTALNDTTYRFKLRPGIKFHDEGDCTADDVVFSLNRVRDPRTGSTHAPAYNQVDQVRAIDRNTVEITTKRPFAPLLSYLCNVRTGSQVLSRKAVERLGDDFGKRPVGTGPFKLVGWEPNEKLEFVKNDQYFIKGLPYLDRVTEYLISDPGAATNALIGGDVHLITVPHYSDIQRIEKTQGVSGVKQPGLNIRHILMNCRIKPLDDVYVRRAFSQAFDKQSVVDAIAFGEGVPMNTMIPPAIPWAYHQGLNAQKSFNPEKARASLAQSKYKGSDLTFAIQSWGVAWERRLAEIAAAQASEVLGIPIRLDIVEMATHTTRVTSGNYQTAVWGWRGLIDPDEYVYECAHSQGARNYAKYSNPKVDALAEKARTILDQDQRAKYYHQAEELLAEDAGGNLPCFNNVNFNGVKNFVKGFIQVPFDGFGQQFDRVWLDI